MTAKRTTRRPTGRFVLDPSTGSGTFSWFALEYETSELIPPKGDKPGELRTHTELGPALYPHEHPELALAFAVAIPAIGVLRKAAEKLERKR